MSGPWTQPLWTLDVEQQTRASWLGWGMDRDLEVDRRLQLGSLSIPSKPRRETIREEI